LSNILLSLRKAWPKASREQLVPFDAMLANRFRAVFPGYISKEEAELCDRVALFLNGIFRSIRADYNLRISGINDELQFFLSTAMRCVLPPFFLQNLFFLHQ